MASLVMSSIGNVSLLDGVLFFFRGGGGRGGGEVLFCDPPLPPLGGASCTHYHVLCIHALLPTLTIRLAASEIGAEWLTAVVCR